MCQEVRNSGRVMGRIQVVVLGDFYQLRPVPNRWTQDPVNYCFVSNLWPHLIPHTIVLTSVQRQDDTNFINAISETARGCPSPNSISLIHSLNDSKERSTVLFSRKIDVFMANHERLLMIVDELREFPSQQNPNITTKTRKSIDAPQTLAQKIGAPVILTMNLSHTLVNGLMGGVEAMSENEIIVYFLDLKETHRIPKKIIISLWTRRWCLCVASFPCI